MSEARKPRPTLGLQRKPSASTAAAAAAPINALQIAQHLRERRQTLREEIHNTLRRADAERYADIADRINDIEDRPLAELLADVSHAEIARDKEEVSDIEMALRRIAAGTYGICSKCHAPIPRERLRAYPTAKRCLSCQQQYEQARGPTAIPKL